MRKLILSMLIFSFMSSYAHIPEDTVNQVISVLSQKYPSESVTIKKGVKQTARLWEEKDGTTDDFIRFCKANYYAADEKESAFLKISDYLEAIYGNFNKMSLQLQRHVHEQTGDLFPIDEMFAAYSPSTHLSDDFYVNKIAFIITLNFPQISLEEKEALESKRLQWAYARLGDIFIARIPADIQQAYSTASSEADIYISNYNVYADHLVDRKGKSLFPKNMVLLSHWNLRDEIKANYSRGKEGFEKQRTIYEVMERIVSQEIPKEVINSPQYDWNPFTNTVYQNKKKVAFTPEETTRYEKFLNNFKTLKAMDKYTDNTYIYRAFSEDTEVSVEDAEALFHKLLSAPELIQVGKIISERLGRELEAFDIWYDGFKSRSTLNEDELSTQTRALYLNAEAVKKQLSHILQKLGFTAERANYLADRISVDAARGSGHAWGAKMKGDNAHLRTRIPEDGMDYKGYNIAIHELGHNVEQTISLYDVDYYMMNGVPNTAFTEALAFIFQSRDLNLLGIDNNNSQKDGRLDILDKVWHLYEISGVSMLDIKVWKWLYANPDATAAQLRDEVIRLSKEIWNTYYAPVFGKKDETILGIYSHMVSYPLYLSSYAFGQIIEFQLEQYLKGKDFAKEVDRIYRLGKLTPNQWMLQATGAPLSIEPMLQEVRKAVVSAQPF